MNTTSIQTAMVFSLAVASGAQADPFTVAGSTADYEIRQDTNTLAKSAQDGGATILDVIGDASFDAQEIRSIFEFDLSSLGSGLASIDSATLYITLEGVDVFPSNEAQLWGSSANRSGATLFSDPGATDEFDAPSYSMLSPDFAPIVNPTFHDVEYTVDLTAFISARYADYQSTPSESWVYLRAQVSQLIGTDFFNFWSADAATASFRPRLEIDATVPSPASALFLGLGGFAMRRRR